MLDELVLDRPEQVKALAHPLRQRILNLLVDAPFTNKQLAVALAVSPPRLHFHVRELEAAGLIELVREQPKGGVIEKYYRATARLFRLGASLSQIEERDELMDTTLLTVRQELKEATEYFKGKPPRFQFAHEPLRLSPERLARIEGHLATLQQEIEEALKDPARDNYTEYVAFTLLLHTLPPVSPVEDQK